MKSAPNSGNVAYMTGVVSAGRLSALGHERRINGAGAVSDPPHKLPNSRAKITAILGLGPFPCTPGHGRLLAGQRQEHE